MVAALHDLSRARLSIALGAAVVLHAAAAFFGQRWAPPVAAEVAESPAPEPTEVELLDEPSERRTDEDSDSHAASGSKLATASTAATPDLRSHPRANVPSENANGTPRAPIAPSPEIGAVEGTYALDPSATAASGASRGTPIELGIGAGDWSRYVDPTATSRVKREGRAALVVPTAPVSSTGGLAEALEARDQSLGLGPAGAVLTAIHDAGYSENSPALGTAVFSITVMRSGAVDVQLTGATSQAEQWVKLGETIAAAIRRKPPRISEARSGVRLGIEVVAEERWPNGQVTRLDSGPKLAVTPPKIQSVDEAKQSLLERNPAAVPDPDAPATQPKLQANYEAPFVGVQGRGKVCSYKIGLSPIPISGGCDFSNIGAKPRRVVSTRVINQTML